MAKKNGSAIRPQKTISNDRVGFSKHLDILRAYSIASGGESVAVSKEDAGKVIDLAVYTVSLTDPFFKVLAF